MASLRTSRRWLRSRVLRALAVAFVIWNLVEVYYIRASWSQAAAHKDRFGRPPRVFIASLHWNDQDVLKDYWNDALMDLVETLGPENVYVSVYESGSWDNTAFHLRALDHALGEIGVNRSVVLDATTHKDEISASPPAEDAPGWITTPQGKRALRRVPFLSKLRNKSVEAFYQLVAQGVVFDKILFLNDVVFQVEDVLELLYTNDGDYGAACSLDFSKPPDFYDTFALRDADGHEHVTQRWPYFRSSRSRKAMKLGIPVPVTSCWNGMVAMPASAFHAPDQPAGTGLAFRGVDDSLAAYHVEGSECCLIHADNPLTAKHGVFVNPRVRVGYSGEAYRGAHPTRLWLSTYAVITGLWRNRLQRWATAPLIALKEWRVQRTLDAWAGAGTGRREKGWFCLINEMHVIVENGWAHV